MDSLSEGRTLAAVTLERGFVAVPAEAPLEMAVQSLRARQTGRGAPRSSPPGVGLRRLLVIGGAVAVTAAATREMVLVLSVNGLDGLGWLILALFVSLFAWIALALTSAVAGFVSVLRGGEGRLPVPAGTALVVRTALLMPVYNEAPGRVMAALEAMLAELAGLGVADRFHVFILSDTRKADAWIAEEMAFLQLRARLPTALGAHVYYRRRIENSERKAGNVADWVKRWGGAYEQFLILDADSVMTGAALARLALTMQETPDAGLIQTLPVIVGGRTLFARMQQFAGRLYGPVIAHGIAWWHGAEGNYWGHNAIIRTVAFAEAAGLPTLRGRKPFGGHILSHDFVEATLLRRAGWAVHMLPEIEGSYEEGPPSLIEIAVRDRRWCQGNLQHAAVLPGRGLHWVSRLHLLMGIGAYVTAPLWLAFLLTGMMLSLEARFIVPEYFAGAPSLFPHWPVIDPVRSQWLFIATMGVLLGPKLLSTLAGLLRGSERRRFGGGSRLLAGVIIETVLAGLIAPVAMLTQSMAVAAILMGRDSGWNPQRREDGEIRLREMALRYAPHSVAGVAFGGAAYLISVPLFLWMLPVVMGLGLAIPLAAWTARRGPAAGLGRLGLLSTPEERPTPVVLGAAAGLQAEYAISEVRPVDRLLGDRVLLEAHRAMLGERVGSRRYDPLLLVGLAKLEDAAGLAEALGLLTEGELTAVLADREGMDRLEELAAGSAERSR